MNKVVLVIDDDQGILDAFTAVLEGEGYTVVARDNAEILKDLDKKKLPDLILLDVLLSGADGRNICRSLKSQKDTKKIPIIMISAHPGARESINKAGADDYLPKPFEVDVLLEMVKKHLVKN